MKTYKYFCKQNDNITALSTKIQSFENTKSEIVGSGLGAALSLTASSTWAAIVAALKGVVNRGAWNGTIGSSGGSVTIPAGHHNGQGKVTGPTLAGLIGSNVTLDNAAKLLSGVTAYGKNGTKYTGTASLASLFNPAIVSVAKTESSKSIAYDYTVPAGKTKLIVYLFIFCTGGSNGGLDFSVLSGSATATHSFNKITSNTSTIKNSTDYTNPWGSNVGSNSGFTCATGWVMSVTFGTVIRFYTRDSGSNMRMYLGGGICAV